jgi:hypothetical protein
VSVTKKCVRCKRGRPSEPFFRDAPNKLHIPGWCRACITAYENAVFLRLRVSAADRAVMDAIIAEAEAARKQGLRK